MNASPHPTPGSGPARAGLEPTRWRNLAWLTIVVAGLLLTTQARAQPAWRGLDVPQYPGSSHPHVSTGHDECKLYFHSPDSPQKVFDFYRGYLEVKDST